MKTGDTYLIRLSRLHEALRRNSVQSGVGLDSPRTTPSIARLIILSARASIALCERRDDPIGQFFALIVDASWDTRTRTRRVVVLIIQEGVHVLNPICEVTVIPLDLIEKELLLQRPGDAERGAPTVRGDIREVTLDNGLYG